MVIIDGDIHSREAEEEGALHQAHMAPDPHALAEAGVDLEERHLEAVLTAKDP